MTAITLSKRGTLTLPRSVRRRLGLDAHRNTLLLIEERESGLFLHPAIPVPIRDLPAAQIKRWIADDESVLARRKLKRR